MRKILPFCLFSFASLSFAGLKVGQKAPVFTTNNHKGEVFDLNSRKGKWTVLYFYPKADTPGCTKQACAFRDAIKVIRELDAEVYGVSTDKVDSLKAFHEKHHLNFELLSDAKKKIVDDYGTRMPVLGISKRYTFILDPDLVIRDINTDVDPAKDPQVVADRIKELRKN